MTAQSPQVQGLLKELKLAREEVEQLKKRLSAVNKEKEEWFRKREEIGKQIAQRISKIAERKKTRNTLTKEVRELKRKRDELNSAINKEVAEIKELKTQYQALLNKSKIKGDPSTMLRGIEALEYRLQTVPMSFEAEQRLMKKIKELKKKQSSLTGVAELHEKIREKSKAIDTIKNEANALHRSIQEQAGASQEHHEALLEQSKSIEELRESEKQMYEKFLEEKKVYQELNNQLKEKQGELKQIKEKLDEHNIQVERSKSDEATKSFKERLREVEEKVSKGSKLTTEDLLLLQRKQD